MHHFQYRIDDGQKHFTQNKGDFLQFLSQSKGKSFPVMQIQSLFSDVTERVPDNFAKNCLQFSRLLSSLSIITTGVPKP